MAKLDNDLMGLVDSAKAVEQETREEVGTGNPVNRLTLVTKSSKILDLEEGEDGYIAGVKARDFVCKSLGKNFGAKFDCAIIGIWSLYKEIDDFPKGSADLPKTYGYYNKTDGMNFELKEGSNFTRKCPNGHILNPIHWLWLKIKGTAEPICYELNSTANRAVSSIQKQLKATGANSIASVLWTLTTEKQENDKGLSWFTPAFTVNSRIYNDDYTYDDKKHTKDEVKELISAYSECQSSYKDFCNVSKLVSRPAIVSNIPQVAALGSDIEEDIGF